MYLNVICVILSYTCVCLCFANIILQLTWVQKLSFTVSTLLSWKLQWDRTDLARDLTKRFIPCKISRKFWNIMKQLSLPVMSSAFGTPNLWKLTTFLSENISSGKWTLKSEVTAQRAASHPTKQIVAEECARELGEGCSTSTTIFPCLLGQHMNSIW